jgi:hypothetical protein
MRDRIAGRFFIVAMLLAAATAMAPAQVPTGTINGIVSDPHDAVVPNAHVVTVSKAQGVSRETSSNRDGLYVFANLPVGDYDLQEVSSARAELVPFNLRHDSTSEHAQLNPAEFPSPNESGQRSFASLP